MKNMLELSKLVLQKVSFDSNLFQKELRKSLNWLKSEDRKQFKTWVTNKFGKSFSKEISKVFNSAN